MKFAYLTWSLILLGIWALIYAARPALRRRMWLAGLCTAPLGLTEPLFVPEYWQPPTLFDLAARTGFDLESLLFAFAAGGIASTLYPALVPVQEKGVEPCERRHPRHRWHRLMLSVPFIAFAALYLASDLNPIYTASLAMLLGGLATGLCRPDLWRPMCIAALLFTALYFLYFASLAAVYPDYVSRVWRLERLSGQLIGGVPLEELLFAATLGLMWGSLYEHLAWRRYSRHRS